MIWSKKKKPLRMLTISLVMLSSLIRPTKLWALDPNLQPIVQIKKGDPSPFDGMMMTRPVFESYEDDRIGHAQCKAALTTSCPDGAGGLQTLEIGMVAFLVGLMGGIILFK